MKTIDFPKVKVIIDGNIIYFRTKPNTVAVLDDVKNVINFILSITDSNKNYGILSDFTEGITMSRKARDFAAQNKVGQKSFHAILINKKFKRFLVDSYLMISQPIMETRVFEDETKAVEWLKEKLSK